MLQKWPTDGNFSGKKILNDTTFKGHNIFTPEALVLIVRPSDRLLRRTLPTLPEFAHRSRARPDPHRGSQASQPRTQRALNFIKIGHSAERSRWPLICHRV